MVMPGSPLNGVLFTPDALLELANDDALVQLAALHDLARERLYPKLPDPPASLRLGPTFERSLLCTADADAIIDGALLELKTRMGTKSKSGSRSDSLTLEALYQLLGYVLFDRFDEYKINAVAFYSARYGTLFESQLDALLEELAGEPVDLTHERAQVWRILGGNDDDPPRRRRPTG
jgi:hypothetical protein